MVCCSSGKARIYYNIPLIGGIKYRFKDSQVWRTISALEILETNCVSIAGSIVSWFCSDGKQGSTEFPYQIKIREIAGGTAVTAGYEIRCNRIDNNQSVTVFTECNRLGPAPSVSLGGNVSYQFSITGSESGNTYFSTTVDRCPDVQTVPCKFDPAKEQHFDVLLIPDATIYLFGVPIKTPPVKECIELTKTGNQVVVEKVKTISRFGSVIDETLEERTILRDIRSPNGCPPPQVRIECCTTPDCKPKDKCPRETDCEKVCNGYKCCYYKGKLIKSIRL